MALKTHVKKIQEARKKYDTALAALGRKEIAKALGAALPAGVAIAWNQYTPGFNDGDPCTFCVGEPMLATTKIVGTTEAVEAVAGIAAKAGKPAVAGYTPAVYGTREVADRDPGSPEYPLSTTHTETYEIAPAIGTCPEGHDPAVAIEAQPEVPPVARVRAREAVVGGELYLTKEDRDAWDLENEGEGCALTYGSTADAKTALAPVEITAAQIADARAVWKLLDKSILETAFGSDKLIVIHGGTGKCVVDEYECGY